MLDSPRSGTSREGTNSGAAKSALTLAFGTTPNVLTTVFLYTSELSC